MDQLLLEEVLKSIPVKYYLINIKTKKIVKTNDEGLNIEHGTCHKNIYKKELPCKTESDLCICERSLQTNNKTDFKTELNHGFGTQFLKTEATKLSDDLVLETISDITDKRQLTKELKINGKRLDRAEKLADFGFWEFNIDDKIVLASDGAKKIYGISNGDLTLSEIQNFPLTKYRLKLDQSLTDLILDEKPYNVKFEIKRKIDGEIRWIHSIAEYRKDKRMVFGVLHDITESERAKKAITRSEKNLQLLFQNMNSAFAFHEIVTNKKGVPVDYVFLDVNNKFEELTGFNRQDVIGKTVKELLPATDQSWIERYGKVALTREPVKFSDYSADLNKYFEVAAYFPKKGFFAVTFNDVSPKIKSQKALENSRRYLELAQQIARIGNWQFEPETKELEWSDEVNKIIERDPSLPVFTSEEGKLFFGKGNYEQFIKLVKKALTEGVPFEFSFKANVPKSKTKWVTVICRPEKNSGSKGYKLSGTIQDVNNSKKIEVELSNSNKLLRTVIDNIPDAIYMKDLNFRKLVANKKDAQRCSVNGVNDIIGKTDFDLYPHEIAEIYNIDDRKVIESGKAILNKEEILPDGDMHRWVLTSKIPLRNDENKIIGLVGIGRDITEIKKNESQLSLLQNVIEQSPLSVVITDTKGKIEYVNPGFEKATGYTREEAIGKNPRILNSGLQNKTYYKNLWNTILSGNNWQGEFNNKRKDGSTYWESVVITPINDENNNIKQFVAIKEDITNTKQLVKDLEVAKNKAEESDRLKTVFLANMSHEIRTPLNGILGFSNIICSGLCDNNELEKYGKIIENSGQRLLTVIDDIIDISMIQANQFKVDHKEFDLEYLLEEIFIVFSDQQQTKLKNISFELKVNPNPNSSNCYMVSDKNRIYQILKNLLDNAFKFTDSGHIKFGCSAYDDSSVTLYVEDSGIGIKEDKLDVIFEIFRQVEEGSSRKYDGSGLGLAIISGIIEKLGGEIKVESELKKGTAFFVKLPRNIDNQPKSIINERKGNQI